MTLIEIMLVVCCFLFAIIPIIQIFSFSIENVKTFHAKSLSYAAAQEMLAQSYLLPSETLVEGSFAFGAEGGERTLGSDENPFLLYLSPMSSSFDDRLIEISKIRSENSPGSSIRMVVRSKDQTRASLDWTYTSQVIHAGRLGR